MPASVPSIKVEKTFPGRDVTLRFSNRYHFNGGTPADGAHWTTLSDAIVAAEKAQYDNAVQIVATIGYAAGSDIPVFSKTYSVAGTLTLVGTISAFSADAAAFVRYATTARTSKNHPIYLGNYYHRPLHSASDPTDDLWSTYLTALGTYAAHWISGFSDGSITAVRAGPRGATATGHFENHLVTHRDLPR